MLLGNLLSRVLPVIVLLPLPAPHTHLPTPNHLLLLKHCQSHPWRRNRFADWWLRTVHSVPKPLRKETWSLAMFTAWWIWKQSSVVIFDATMSTGCSPLSRWRPGIGQWRVRRGLQNCSLRDLVLRGVVL